MEEGIVPGGGVAYLRCINELDKMQNLSADEKVGVDIVKKSLEEPLKQIVLNAGLEESEILQRVKTVSDDFGFNAKTEQYEHLLETGIIDPKSKPSHFGICGICRWIILNNRMRNCKKTRKERNCS